MSTEHMTSAEEAPLSRLTTTGAALLAVVPVLLSTAAPTAAGAAVARPADSTTNPTLTTVVEGGDFTVTGSRHLTPGPIDITLQAKGGAADIAVLGFAKGYSFADYRSDVRYYSKHGGSKGQPSKKALTRLRRAFAGSTGYGGIQADKGKTVGATISLPAGDYTLYDDTTLPVHPRPLTIAGSVRPDGSGTAPTATVTMTSNDHFGGDTTLPASGTIAVADTSTKRKHFLTLQHIKTGTTKKTVSTYFHSDASKEPSWLRSGVSGTDVLSADVAQTLTYSLPAGEYLEVCFLPEIKDGASQASNGMFRIVHLTSSSPDRRIAPRP